MKKSIFLVVLLLLHLLLLFNVRFTAWPEMLSYPYLFSKGFKFYSDFVYPYPPLLTLILAAFYKIFGFKILTLKIVSWLFIFTTDVFLFLIAKKLLKKESLAFLLLVPYLLLQSFLDGNMLWFDNALVLPVVASFYFLANWLANDKPKDLILTGIFLASGVFIKQTAAVYFIAAIPFILFSTSLHRSVERLKSFLIIPTISAIVFFVYLLSSGSLKDFWVWSLYYPLAFWSKFPGYNDFSLSLDEKLVFVLVFVPFLGAFLVRGKIFRDKVFFLALAFLIASILAIYPRFTYFHLQPLFAVAFIGFALVFSYLRKFWYIGLLGLVSLLAIYQTFNYSLIKSVRFQGEEDQKIIKIVSLLSAKDERVFLLGLYSSVYVFADRLPPKPWADNFGWYWEIEGFQETVITAFEKDPPTVIFSTVQEEGNWFDLAVYRPKRIVEYISKNYYLEAEPIKGIEMWKRKFPDM